MNIFSLATGLRQLKTFPSCKTPHIENIPVNLKIQAISAIICFIPSIQLSILELESIEVSAAVSVQYFLLTFTPYPPPFKEMVY